MNFTSAPNSAGLSLSSSVLSVSPSMVICAPEACVTATFSISAPSDLMMIWPVRLSPPEFLPTSTLVVM